MRARGRVRRSLAGTTPNAIDPPRGRRRARSCAHGGGESSPTPRWQHGGEADASAEMFGIFGDREGRVGSRLEQEIVDHLLVLIGDIGDRCRQGVDDMEVRDRQQLCLALGQPLTRGCRLAPRAVSITATAVRDDGVAALLVLAARNIATERRRAAALDRTHDLQLLQADMATVGFTPSGTVVAENPRPPDLTEPCGRRYTALGLRRFLLSLRCLEPSCLSGLSMVAIRPVATRVYIARSCPTSNVRERPGCNGYRYPSRAGQSRKSGEVNAG